MRETIDRYLADLANDLQHDPLMIGRLEQLKVDLLESPRVREFAGEVWTSMKDTLDASLGDADSELRQGFRSAVVEVGVRLSTDAELAAKVDEWVADAAAYVVRNYRHEIAGVITETVERWDPKETHREAGAPGRARPAVHPHQRHGGRRARGARDLLGRNGDPRPALNLRSERALSHGTVIPRSLVGKRTPGTRGVGVRLGGMHERAGTQATESDLIDVETLVRAYYEKRPDASVPEQRVVFGTSGHRGSSLNASFNEHHILAIDAGHLRLPRSAGHHRAALHRRRHPRAERAGAEDRARRARGQRRATCSPTRSTATRRRRPSRTPS